MGAYDDQRGPFVGAAEWLFAAQMSAFGPRRTFLIAARDSIAPRDPKLPNR